MIWKNINDKLRFQRELNRNSFEQSDVEQTSSYERKMAYFIRFHLRDILTSDHRHVWFNIQTKSLDDIQDRSQILMKVPDEIPVVYSFGSMLSYDTFMGHFNDRPLARIYVQKFPKAINLETTTHNFIIHLKNIDPQILINHSTNDNSIQMIFQLQASPIIKQRNEQNHPDKKRMMEEIPLCSDLLIRFFPANMAWIFLRDLPIAGYSRRASDNVFHINFALFEWHKHSDNLPRMGKPSYNSHYDSYGIEMLWSLGYKFQDKHSANSQWIRTIREKKFYNLCCTIWHNLKKNHCYQIQDALNEQTLKIHDKPSNVLPQLKEVPFVIITPHRIEYQPLQSTICHRGFDLYPSENWLLVHIRDYNGIDKIRDIDVQMKVYFRNKMLQGIRYKDRQYRYFGSSNSQMKDQAGWFLSVPVGENMKSAREKVGDVSKIRQVSTYTARVGLYLTTSKPTEIKLTYKGESEKADGEPYIKRTPSFFSRMKKMFFKSRQETIEYMAITIPDIERNDFKFTDGCGKISFDLAKKVAISIGIPIMNACDIPSAFQIRIAGCKGMLSIDPESKLGDNKFYILVRESMIKFDGTDWTLHIVDHARPMPLSLNNQVIRLLSDLGISNGVFESIQTRCIDRQEFWHPPAKSYLNALDSLDQSVINSMRQKYKNTKYFLRRNKIPLPLNEARNLFGIADETGKLKPGQCFIQYRNLENSSRSEKYKVHEGSVIVTKNPCLHPGDIRKLEAVFIPELENCIRDCIVFSTEGFRPTCNEIAGSDLDGDQYWVYWGDEIKITNVEQPFFYPSAKNSRGTEVTDELIVDHVLDTFTNNLPGLISNIHKVIAEKHPHGTRSKECQECAALFSRAIDACKTGETISRNRINELKEAYYKTCPTWMMKFDKPKMDPPSKSINEILYRKALEAYIHPDNYQDVLRPLHPDNYQGDLRSLSDNERLDTFD
ncbi:unnamed protein product [Adineta steineri]|uniref:RNA-dependent RNA polymerase n=1 Tax=Adineta steineri TaxID=433720 RepID=A0A815BSL2_9BILA|nr:unnamed protein product [Adineta steineri]CAF1274344.1 unnamed protein product [Adineta steineri]